MFLTRIELTVVVAVVLRLSSRSIDLSSFLTMRLDPYNDQWVKEMLRAGFSVRAVHSVLPEASRSALYRKRRNLFTFRAVPRPKEACVPRGVRQLITPEMEDWTADLLA